MNDEELNLLPKSRREAKELGEKFYYTGKECKNGHVCERRTSGGNCIECHGRPTGTRRTYFKEDQKLIIENIEKNNFKYLEELEKLPRSRQKALKEGSDFYYSKILCANGHLDKRYTSDTHCIQCNYEKNKKWNEINKDYVKEYNKEWNKNNVERSRQNKFLWSKNNKEKVIELRKKSKIKSHKNPFNKLNDNVSCLIRKSLKDKKNGRHWETLVKFTSEDLIKHLESLFESWMTWENWGKYDKNKKTWQIDHIKPLSLCKTFEEAWKLENLQPLEAKQNLIKGNRYIEIKENH